MVLWSIPVFGARCSNVLFSNPDWNHKKTKNSRHIGCKNGVDQLLRREGNPHPSPSTVSSAVPLFSTLNRSHKPIKLCNQPNVLHRRRSWPWLRTLVISLHGYKSKKGWPWQGHSVKIQNFAQHVDYNLICWYLSIVPGTTKTRCMMMGDNIFYIVAGLRWLSWGVYHPVDNIQSDGQYF